MGDEKSFHRWRPHPWHGLPVGSDPPAVVNAYIEITPFDLVKYEVDKASGYLRVDRPQRTSSLPPSLYGFIPQTYCGDRVGRLLTPPRPGDGDPLDICVLSERPINHSEVILNVRVIGAMKTIDHDKADDKIIAVLEKDPLWDAARDVADIPAALIERLRHYFSTYKTLPGEPSRVTVEETCGAEQARMIVRAAMDDYKEQF